MSNAKSYTLIRTSFLLILKLDQKIRIFCCFLVFIFIFTFAFAFVFFIFTYLRLLCEYIAIIYASSRDCRQFKFFCGSTSLLELNAGECCFFFCFIYYLNLIGFELRLKFSTLAFTFIFAGLSKIYFWLEFFGYFMSFCLRY